MRDSLFGNVVKRSVIDQHLGQIFVVARFIFG